MREAERRMTLEESDIDPHSSDLIATIALGLGAAFVGGLAARLLRLPEIVGYLLAGVAIGPYTPGLVADPDIALELAELGVGLLMFAVGLHFNVGDLLAVRGLAVPGAIGQIAAAVALGGGVAVAFGEPLDSALVVGLAISVASTVVLLRTLSQRALLDTEAGRTAVGWLIVEDLFTVLVLVLLPTLALLGDDARGGPLTDTVWPLTTAVAKAGVLTTIMLALGPRVLPRVLSRVERFESRELFTVSVLAIALGIAFAASVVFDVSLALGAFLAGAVLSESHLSHEAEAAVRPMTDTFTVLFFVSVGMLLDPGVLVAEAPKILAALGVIVVGKSFAALAIVALRGAPLSTGLTVAAGLAQIGEFSFIVATAGLELDLISETAFQVIVAASLLSITMNPFLFSAIEPAERWISSRPALARWLRADPVVR